jgi:hypothetical protein
MIESLKYNEKGQAIINDLYGWMDGGTVSVWLASVNSQDLKIDFTQKADFNNKLAELPAGSLVLDGHVVEVRSDLEKDILTTLKSAVFNDSLLPADRQFKNALDEAIQYVESDAYIELARRSGI